MFDKASPEIISFLVLIRSLYRNFLKADLLHLKVSGNGISQEWSKTGIVILFVIKMKKKAIRSVTKNNIRELYMQTNP